ncbi:MAG: extracellular solute-binding protein [Rhodospirillaceae bacterium]|nr:extracellular solute-binding protein [Rhodospirillaceae bacterium]
MSTRTWAAIFAAAGLLAAVISASPSQAMVKGKPVHALALHGEPKHGPDFTHFDFVNPDAPKGGTLITTNGNDATFDTFNGFTLKGAPVRLVGIMHDTLMASGQDEPFTMYCLVCETAEVADDNTWVEFKIRDGAKFSDDSPITGEDVAFTFAALVEKGAPIYRLYYADVSKVEAKDPKTVRFLFKNAKNRELPAILGQLPVLSKAYWEKRDFTATTLDIPVGSGAYTIDTYEIGRHVEYKRVANYWGANLAVNRGMNNFDRIRVEYFRDNTVRFESFKTGAFDFYQEYTARQWATGYEFPAVRDGRVKKMEVIDGSPMTAQSITVNLRRPMFQDRRVREALGYAFDFESLNNTIFYKQYTRLRSYWQKSDLEAKGLPSAAEMALLEPLRDKIPPEVFTAEFTRPTTDGQGDVRANLEKARDLLTAAGWVVKNGQLVNEKTNQPFIFEITEVQQGLETVLNPWIKNLERLGIKATIRIIDSTQFINRLNEFDYEVMTLPAGNTLSPGNEQAEFWSSEAADRKGSRNYSGVKDPAVDALVQKVIDAEDRDRLIAATRALDRVLTWNHYRLLTYSTSADRYAVWNKLKHPEKTPLLGLGNGAGIISWWWMDPAAAQTPAASGTPATETAAEPKSPGSNRLGIILLAIAAVAVVGFVFLRRRGK